MMHGNVKDLTGMRFGRLRVLNREGSTKDGCATWACICDCGSKLIVRGHTMRDGRSKSCGCLSREFTGKQFTTHGKSSTPEYRSWLKMRERCHNPRHHQHSDYGGRGIGICKRWDSFAAFVEDMGERPTPQHTLDRINNNGNYEPGNCRWATRKDQNRNTRISRPVCADDGREFASAGHAADCTGGSESAIRNACRTGREYLGCRWRYVADQLGRAA